MTIRAEIDLLWSQSFPISRPLLLHPMQARTRKCEHHPNWPNRSIMVSGNSVVPINDLLAFGSVVDFAPLTIDNT